MTARLPVAGLTSDGAKIIIIVEETKKNDEKVILKLNLQGEDRRSEE